MRQKTDFTDRQTPHQAFTAYLQQHRLKITPQRRLILDIFLLEPGHVSSEELYAKVKRRDTSIGQATVYRTLKLLVESGLAGALVAGDGPTLYEHGYGHAHHDHLVCLICGAKAEIVDPEIEKRQEDLAKSHGFSLTRHSMVLYGHCPGCRERGQSDTSGNSDNSDTSGNSGQGMTA